ncbi:Uncharacterised protein [Mycobacteroides abscessus subsp. abscessus]|nr:Uncharacterised protein [Mycobacteroides abscessus subsp. abscessus]
MAPQTFPNAATVCSRSPTLIWPAKKRGACTMYGIMPVVTSPTPRFQPLSLSCANTMRHILAMISLNREWSSRRSRSPPR